MAQDWTGIERKGQQKKLKQAKLFGKKKRWLKLEIKDTCSLGTELTAPPFTRTLWPPGMGHLSGENTAMDMAWDQTYPELPLGRKGGIQRTSTTYAAHSEDGCKDVLDKGQMFALFFQALLSIHHCIIQPCVEIRQTSDLIPRAHFLHLILTELSSYAEFCNSCINITL